MRMRVCYVDCHEAGLRCYLVIYLEKILRPLQLFSSVYDLFADPRIYVFSIIFRINSDYFHFGVIHPVFVIDTRCWLHGIGTQI
jgi:hypothetical protein